MCDALEGASEQTLQGLAIDTFDDKVTILRILSLFCQAGLTITLFVTQHKRIGPKKLGDDSYVISLVNQIGRASIGSATTSETALIIGRCMLISNHWQRHRSECFIELTRYVHRALKFFKELS